MAWEAQWAQECHKHDREVLRSFKQRLEIEGFENAQQTQLVEILGDCQSQVFQQDCGADPSPDESAALVSAPAHPATPSGAFLSSPATLQERDAARAPTTPDFSGLYTLPPFEEGYVDPSDMEMSLALLSPWIDENQQLVSELGYGATSFEIQSAPASGGHLATEWGHPTLDDGRAMEDDRAGAEGQWQ